MPPVTTKKVAKAAQQPKPTPGEKKTVRMGKRGVESSPEVEDGGARPSKVARRTADPIPSSEASGTLYCFGTNISGQLGFECEQRKYPALVPLLETKKIVAVACGGMHTVALEDNGKVWTFGCNDDKALGRRTEEQEDEIKPGEVELPTKVVQISAGDSHSAALTESGEVFTWGCFKDNNGNYGLTADDNGDMCRENPVNITSHLGVRIMKISSGAHHIAMLSETGQVYTCGTSDQSQLGREQPQAEERRVTRSMTRERGNDAPVSKKEYLLKPAEIKISPSTKITNIWTGEFSTYCTTKKSNEIYVWGLNNYAQLGITPRNNDTHTIVRVPTKTNSFRGKTWKEIAAGQHHTVALDEEGKVFTLGRHTYGMLGIGAGTPDQEHYDVPTLVQGLADKKCVHVAAGGSTSYAVTDEGHLYAWGFGENLQLACGDDDDRNVPTRCFGKPKTNIEGKVIRVAAGGQHVALALQKTVNQNGNA